MDHVVDYIDEYMGFELKELYDEWNSKEYENLSDCPSYKTVQAYCKSRNVLVRHMKGGYVEITPKQALENFEMMKSL